MTDTLSFLGKRAAREKRASETPPDRQSPAAETQNTRKGENAPEEPSEPQRRIEGFQEDRPLSAFASSGRCVTVYSRILRERILFAADDAEAPETELVVYRAAELKGLVGCSPDALRHIHAVKKVFRGEVLEGEH